MIPAVTRLDVSLSLAQVCRLLERLEGRPVSRTGVTQYAERVNDKEPLVKPSKRISEGRGRGDNERTYSAGDVVLLRWLLQLKREGLEVRRFFKAVDWLRKKLPEVLLDPDLTFFLTDNNELALWCKEGERIDLTGSPGQILLKLKASDVSETIDQAEALSTTTAA